MTNAALIDLGVVHFALESDDAPLLDTISRIFCPSPLLTARANPTDVPLHSITVRKTTMLEDGRPTYVIEVEGGGRQTCADRVWATHITASLMSERLIAGLTRQFTTFHAAAFSKGPLGILVPGTSHSGKSTTAAIFALAGFHHYTDDVAVLDEEYRLLPFPRIIVLRSGGWARLQDLYPGSADQQLVWGSEATASWYVAPPDSTDAPDQEGRGPDVRLILLPVREPSTPTLMPLARSEVVPTLIKESFAIASDPAVALEHIVNVARQADCYRINMARPREAVQAVSALTDASSPQ